MATGGAINGAGGGERLDGVEPVAKALNPVKPPIVKLTRPQAVESFFDLRKPKAPDSPLSPAPDIPATNAADSVTLDAVSTESPDTVLSGLGSGELPPMPGRVDAVEENMLNEGETGDVRARAAEEVVKTLDTEEKFDKAVDESGVDKDALTAKATEIRKELVDGKDGKSGDAKYNDKSYDRAIRDQAFAELLEAQVPLEQAQIEAEAAVAANVPGGKVLTESQRWKQIKREVNSTVGDNERMRQITEGVIILTGQLAKSEARVNALREWANMDQIGLGDAILRKKQDAAKETDPIKKAKLDRDLDDMIALQEEKKIIDAKATPEERAQKPGTLVKAEIERDHDQASLNSVVEKARTSGISPTLLDALQNPTDQVRLGELLKNALDKGYLKYGTQGSILIFILLLISEAARGMVKIPQ